MSDNNEESEPKGVPIEDWTAETFEIPHRPERESLDDVQVRDENGDPVMEDGEPKTVAGGSVIEGYCRFDLFTDEFNRDAVNDVLRSYDGRDDYLFTWWEDYNALLYDNDEMCTFEVRVLLDHVAIDVKANTTAEAVRAFIEEFVIQASGEWRLNRTSERVRA